MSNTQTILVVDDDAQIREMLEDYLGMHGFEVFPAENGESMHTELTQHHPDLVLLNVNKPGEDGLTLARHLREYLDIGVIMVTAAGDVVDRILGLEVGADDYVAKPFDPRELLARIKSVLRRMDSRREQPETITTTRSIRFGRFALDLDAHRLLDAEGMEVAITSMEYELLKALGERPNRVLSRDQILNLTQNRDWDPFDRSIDIRVTRIRRKIEADPSHPRIIRTVRGTGYMFVPDPD